MRAITCPTESPRPRRRRARQKDIPLLGWILISVVSNEIPKLTSDLIAAALQGDVPAARTIQLRILPLMTGNFLESNPGPVKAVMKRLGILEHDDVRPPLAPVTAATREKLDEILRECGLR